MDKLNCWEFKKCGREVGGVNVKSLGVCPAATYVSADGFCEGNNGGRACAYITGTICTGTVNGSFTDKAKDCVKCDFFKTLKKTHPYEFNVLQFHKYVNKQVKSQDLVAVI